MIALISDIHGNWAALEKVLAKIDSLDVKQIINLGDTAGYYSFINECCEALRERAAFSLLGNHDHYLIQGLPCERSRSATHCLEHQQQVITEENLAWLTALPTSASIFGINCVHGGWLNHLEEYFNPKAGYFNFSDDTLFASGHTHVPIVWSDGGKQYCNPGSVGQPRDGDPRASFAIFDDKHFHIIRVEYDSTPTKNAMRDLGFPNTYWTNLDTGSRIGGGIDSYPKI